MNGKPKNPVVLAEEAERRIIRGGSFRNVGGKGRPSRLAVGDAMTGGRRPSAGSRSGTSPVTGFRIARTVKK